MLNIFLLIRFGVFLIGVWRRRRRTSSLDEGRGGSYRRLYLPKPATCKESIDRESARTAIGATSMQGWRSFQEDAHAVLVNFDGDKTAFFAAVYDGHGGQEVAALCGDRLHRELLRTPEYKAGHFAKALTAAFLHMDEVQRQNWPRAIQTYNTGARMYPFPVTIDSFYHPGCTAVVALLKEETLYVANAGDSRAVLCHAGTAVPRSVDHKPSLPGERERIFKAGGYVVENRVNGGLNLSRAIGDFAYKRGHLPPEEQIITACPEVTEIELQREDEFLILACDGIWERRTDQEVVDFVKERLDARGGRGRVSQVGEELLDDLLSKDPPLPNTENLGCDNMTVVIIDLHRDLRKSVCASGTAGLSWVGTWLSWGSSAPPRTAAATEPLLSAA